MAVSPGTRTGIYEIVEQIGAGGMGEVYRGLDASLNPQTLYAQVPLGHE